MTYAEHNIDTKGATSGSVKTLCPQCSATRKKKTDPCLSVDLDKGAWYCHNCGWAGGLGLARHDSPAPARRPDTPRPAFTTQPLTPDALAWLAGRGISQATAERFNLKSCLYWFPKLGRKGPAVALPFYRGGKCANVKIRSTEDKSFAQVKGGNQVLFGFDYCDGHREIAITEGELDAVAIAESGFGGGACSCPGGAPTPGTENLEKRLGFIDDARAIFDAAETVYIAMDNDQAGVPWAAAVADRIGLHKCREVSWPEGCKDANDTLLKHGKECLLECLRKSRPWPCPGIVELETETEAILEYWRLGGAGMGYSTGWGGMDSFLKLDTKTLNVLTGIPMSGKSEWLDQLMLNTVRIHRWKWAIYSPENYPLPNHFQKLAEKYLAKPMFGRYAQAPMDELDIRRAIDFLSDNIKFLSFGERPAKFDEILTRLKVCKARWGINAAIIDPYNELDHSRPGSMTESEYISQFLGALRNFSRLYEVAIWIVAHPTKLQKDPQTEEYPRPTPYDISGSAHWRNKADVCVSVWRSLKADPQAPPLVEINVQKVRNKNLGACGTVKMTWQRSTGIFSECRAGDSAWNPPAEDDNTEQGAF